MRGAGELLRANYGMGVGDASRVRLVEMEFGNEKKLEVFRLRAFGASLRMTDFLESRFRDG
jgi:hypothetical protein